MQKSFFFFCEKGYVMYEACPEQLSQNNYLRIYRIKSSSQTPYEDGIAQVQNQLQEEKKEGMCNSLQKNLQFQINHVPMKQWSRIECWLLRIDLRSEINKYA